MSADRSRVWRRLGRVALGFALGLAPFLVPFLEPLTYRIPLSLRPELRAATALLAGCLAFIVGERESFTPRRRKILGAWALAAPIGLALLGWSQSKFVVPYPIHSGLQASEIIAPPRIAGCPCAERTDTECLRFLTHDPARIALCWEGSRRTRNGVLWSLGYLLLIGGAQSGLGLLWVGSREARRSRRAPAPQTARAEHTLFLSYSRRDREFAERLAGDLKDRLQDRGIAVWSDWRETAVGDSLPRKIEEAISNSAWFGIILSPDSIASPWVRKELEMALTMEVEGRLTILAAALCEPSEIPLSLRGKVWADFTSSYEDGLEALLDRLAVPSRLDAPERSASQ